MSRQKSTFHAIFIVWISQAVKTCNRASQQMVWPTLYLKWLDISVVYDCILFRQTRLLGKYFPIIKILIYSLSIWTRIYYHQINYSTALFRRRNRTINNRILKLLFLQVSFLNQNFLNSLPYERNVIFVRNFCCDFLLLTDVN